MCRSCLAYAGWWALLIIMSAVAFTLMAGAWGLLWGAIGLVILLGSALLWGDGK